MKHKEFAEAMRNIMRDDGIKPRGRNHTKTEGLLDEDGRSLQELLETKFNELFGPIEDNEE